MSYPFTQLRMKTSNMRIVNLGDVMGDKLFTTYYQHDLVGRGIYHERTSFFFGVPLTLQLKITPHYEQLYAAPSIFSLPSPLLVWLSKVYSYRLMYLIMYRYLTWNIWSSSIDVLASVLNRYIRYFMSVTIKLTYLLRYLCCCTIYSMVTSL